MVSHGPKPGADELHQRILEHCQTLGLPLDRDQLDGVLRRAEQEHISHLELVERLLCVPAQRRRERSTERRIQNAKFREPLTLEAFDWKFNAQFLDRVQMEELATGDFIRRRDNLVFVGQSGTVT
jgi:DNA replication protein DnaC